MKAIPVFSHPGSRYVNRASQRGRDKTPTEEPACNDLCTFIVNVMKEEPTGSRPLKGKALKDRIDPTWVRTYNFSAPSPAPIRFGLKSSRITMSAFFGPT